MKTKLLAAAAVLALAAAAPAAHADVSYTSQLNYKDTGGSTPTAGGPYGLVTIDQVDAKDLKITVTLDSPEHGFLNTGGPHNPFVFNLADSNNANITVTPIDGVGQTFTNGGFGTFDSTPFGNFTNDIGCCNGQNGASHQSPPPLIFTIHDTAGITFAGIGATFDGSGKVLTLGTGDHLVSNTTGAMGGGWWFAADLVTTDGATFNVAARDAFLQAGIPEPASWALMIVGFGGVGAMMRRRRLATA